jgi:xanthine dehydrogenase YagR molybdenum-binding subunit
MLKVIKTRTEFEGHFSEEYVVVEGEGLPAWEAGADLKSVGHMQPRVDGPERVTGKALFTHDIRLPGMLYGKILRSPHPHGRIKHLETEKAERVPGVRAVLSHRNVPPIPFWGGQTFLFDKTVRFAGDEISCVIADDEEICEDALDLIDVEYELLPFVIDPEEALKPDAPKIHPDGNLFGGAPDIYERGKVEEGLGRADIVLERTFNTQTALHNCLETHGSLALWEGDQLILYDSTQHIFGVRATVSELLGLPLHKVRVIKKYMGGGFGSKNRTGKYTSFAALAAKMTGRPVKIMLDRTEENLSAGNRPSTKQVLKIGAKRDGALTALHLKAISAAGAYAVWPSAIGGPARQLYACANVKTEQYAVFTNTGPMSAFRGPGYAEGTFALESAMDELARDLGIDPLDLRLRNYSAQNPMVGRPYSTKGLRAAYERGSQLIGWKEPPPKEEGPRRRGLGMASQIWGGSGGPPAYAIVKLNPDGTATVLTGTQDIGTGTKTALAQIAAEELGFPIGAIVVEIGDTGTGPYAPISAGSMTLPSVGPAVRVAAHEARQQLLEVGAQVLEIPRDRLEIRNGKIVSPALREPVPAGKILSKLKNFMIIGKGARSPNPEEVSVNTFGAQFAQVEVDTETGDVRVERIVAVHDSGRVINPLTLSSQVEGGVLQGLGYGLTEQRVLDRAFGAVLNADLENYKIPTAMDVPEIAQDMIDLPDHYVNNLGSKGVGEPPIIPTAPAIANAIADAIGVRIRQLPMTREKILEALKTGIME